MSRIVSVATSQTQTQLQKEPNRQGVIYLLPDQEPQVIQYKPIKTKKEKSNRKIIWSQDVVDNENAEKLRSNVCCIYHKPHGQTSSSTCTSDDQTNMLERERKGKLKHKEKCSKLKKKK